MMKFSPSTTLFYDPQINAGDIPSDAMDITREMFDRMLAARASGKVIRSDGNGMPVAQDPDPPAPLTLEERKTQLIAQATARRWTAETGGITLPTGVRVGTAKDDQDRITSVVVNARIASIESVDFKAQTGWVRVTLEEVRAIATAIARHVQACFSAERQHHEAIAALYERQDRAGLDAYDVTTGWPA